MTKRLLFYILSAVILGLTLNFYCAAAAEKLKIYSDANIDFKYPAFRPVDTSKLAKAQKAKLKVAVSNGACNFNVIQGRLGDNQPFKLGAEYDINLQVKALKGKIAYSNFNNNTAEAIFSYQNKKQKITQYIYAIVDKNNNVYNLVYASESKNFNKGCKPYMLATVKSIKIKITKPETINQSLFRQYFNSISLGKLAMGMKIKAANVKKATVFLAKKERFCYVAQVKKLVNKSAAAISVNNTTTGELIKEKVPLASSLSPGASANCENLSPAKGSYQFKFYLKNNLVFTQPFEVK